MTVSPGEPSIAFKYGATGALAASAVLLLAAQHIAWLGWLLLAATAVVVAFRPSRFRTHMFILLGSLALLGVVPINTDVSFGHFVLMGAALLATVIGPYLLTTFVLKDNVIVFPFALGRKWLRREVAYVLFAGVAAYFILPYYLASTGSYLNWQAVLEPSYIVRLFIGTNALGIWDELFFVGVCLALLRQHVPFMWANVVQAVLWTAFLYELGFRGWGPIAIFIFALTQGYIFKRTESLLYILTVHLTIDFVLFLVLVHLHNPEVLRIFITSPML